MKKKDWWDKSWNPIKGCNGPAGNGIHCKYCYACGFVKRFAEKIARKEIIYKYKNLESNNFASSFVENEYKKLVQKIKAFKPHFFEYVLAQPLVENPNIHKIYFFSMSDPADWEQFWYERIVEKIKQYPQHRFVVLTKRPWVYEKFQFPKNVWCGVTITKNQDIKKNIDYFNNTVLIMENTIFLSIEPIQEKIIIPKFTLKCHDWIIVGPETGTSRKTPGEWLDPFFSLDTPVFMKIACQQMTDKPLRQEWPEGWER